MRNLGYQGVEEMLPDEKEHRRKIARLANNLLHGKQNNVIQVTLAHGSTTTTVVDKRIGAYTALLFSPLTLDAVTAQTSGLYVSSQQNGQATLSHASSPNTDQTFNVVLVG